jgi:prepilin-type processing-associated H-X9-DG protein
MLRTLWIVCIALTLLAFISQSTVYGQADARKKSVNNLKQLALAMINYADANGGTMPPATVYSKDGKALYSWRVLLLPYLEEGELYKQFKLDEPWDSENNKPLLEKMPAIFAPVAGATKEKNVTFYQVVVGKGAAFEDKQKIRFPASFTDGTSNTIMIVEGAEAAPWSKPADVVFDPDKALPKFGGMFKEGFNVAFADGSVHFIGNKADKDTLKAAITRNGGEVIDIDKLK